MRALTSRRVRIWFALTACVLIWIYGGDVAHSISDNRKVTQMTDKMKTVCVGRFLIDLPPSAKYSLGQIFIDGFHVSGFPETADQFAARVAVREAQLGAERNQRGRKSLESATKIEVNGFNGKVLVFGRNSSYLMDFNTRRDLEEVVVEGYVHSGGFSFDFISDGYDPALVGNLVKLINKLRLVAQNDIPSAPGFCFGPGMLLDPLTADQGEGMTMFVAIPGHADLAISFTTMAGLKGGTPGLLARNAKSTEREPFWVRAAFRTLREGKRTINGLPGEELVMRVTELNFSTVYGLDWEMVGTETNVLAPFIHLEMETGRNPNAGGKPVQSSLSQAAVLALWDQISSSVRLRPSEPPKRAGVVPPVSPIGAYASAGEVCPQTGWWQCSEGGNRIGVLGGQRQYLKKGQRIPQALLLPPQTLWEKVRGIQPSYESAIPTSWKLVDKRSKPRKPPQVELAQATVVPQADARSSTGVAALAAEPMVPLGTYVKTGTSCPASGWWCCEESNALDGTRWFTQGSLLPAATFKVPPGAFSQSRGAPEVIQRRSSWQLVRYAQAPDPLNVNAGPEPVGGDVTLPDDNGGGNKVPPHSSA
jgi:hypothetical protein